MSKLLSTSGMTEVKGMTNERGKHSTNSPRYVVQVKGEDGRTSRYENPIVVIYDVDGANLKVRPLCEWKEFERVLLRLAPQEFWEGVRQVVDDIDDSLDIDKIGLAPDVSDMCHRMGIAKLTDIPWVPLREAIFRYVHGAWLFTAMEPMERELIDILAAIARQHILVERGDRE